MNKIRPNGLGILFSGIILLLCFPLPRVLASATETERLYLSGHGKDDPVAWNFFCTSGAHSGYWTNLPVPSQWDVKGFGTLNYFKDPTNAWNERGLYEHDFAAPSNWAGKRIFLVFDGSMTDTDAKLNGQSVGPIHQGAFYRFKYEVTSLLKLGATNKIEVAVSKHSANESVNKAERSADYWVFGGIFRPVYLEAEPMEFIERVAIDAKADGSFSADVFLNSATNSDEVEAQLQTLDGKNIGDPFNAKVSAESGGLKAVLRVEVKSAFLWTAETPNLYSVEFRLKHKGQVIHQVQQRFGFRTFEVRDGDGLYLNGQRVILKGACRHSFWPDSGRCLSEAVQRLDIETLKDANMNAVRMSHYPPDEQFLDLCDERGIYVLDELAGWHHYYDNEVGPKRVREMVVRDVNHPSILFWDNGNEGGFNTNLDRIFGELDPQKRRVLHPWSAFNGINTGHYLQYDQATLAASGVPIYYHSNGKTFAATNDTATYIYMPTEFIHALYDGGGGAGLDDYWRMMTASTNLGGGFIWALLDDGVKRPDTGEIDVAGNQAPDGIVGPYRQREGSYYAVKEIWSPIQVAQDTNGGFEMENHYSFINASQCKLTWQLRKFARPWDRTARTETNFTVVAEATANGPEILPGGRGALTPALPRFWEREPADVVALRVDDPYGRELWTWTWPMPAMAENLKMPNTSKAQATFSSDSNHIDLKCEDLRVRISKSTGLLEAVERGGNYSLVDGPKPVLGNSTLTGLKTNMVGGDVVVSEAFDGALRNVTWRLRSDGWLQCDYTYAAEGTNDYLGVLFYYPENLVTHKRWLGDGPYHVWKNRLRGVSLGVWDNDYNNTLTGYRDWIYPEFKGYFAKVRWMQMDTKEGIITVVNNSGVPYIDVLTLEFPPVKLVGKAIAPMPQCGLGFLDFIPPIGSKFKDATFGGPQGQPNTAQGEYSGSVSFYFGTPH